MLDTSASLTTGENEMAEETVETKKPLRSKTLWANVLAGVALFANQMGGWINITPGETGATLVFLNLLLRLVTKGRISLS